MTVGSHHLIYADLAEKRVQEFIKREEMTDDKVDHPKHYNAGKIEVIDFIEDQDLTFCLGNVVKYICRAAHKGDPVTDLKKARWYLDREIKNLEEKPLAGAVIAKMLTKS